MKEIKLSPGELLFQENEPSDMMYIIQTGEIEVFTTLNGERQSLGTFPTGDMFAELGLILGNPRSASAVATAPTTLLGLTQGEFFQKVKTDATFAARLIKRLAVKLASANALIKEEVSVRTSLEITYGRSGSNT
jgi:CRP-like cAMP-binding protein